MNHFASVLVSALAQFSLRAAAIIVVAALGALAMRRAPAASRHAVWAIALAAVTLLPAFAFVVPPIRVGIRVPVRSASPYPIAAATPPVAQPSFPPAAGAIAPPPDSSSAPPRAAAIVVPGSTPESPVNIVSLQEVVGAVWLVGALFLLARLAAALVFLRRLVGRSREFDFDRASVESTGARVRLADVAVPMTFGMSRPVILLPGDAVSWPAGRIAAAIRHEAAHVRRRDWCVQLLARFVCAIYWFHPLVHWCADRMRDESERASDDLALAGGLEALDYAGHLVDVARCARRNAAASVACAMARSSRIESRVQAILAPERSGQALSAPAFFVIWAALAVTVTATALVRFVPVALADSPRMDGAATAVSASDSATIVGTDAGHAYRVTGLGDGLAATLVGVGDADGSRWWSPSGTRLPAAPVAWPRFSASTVAAAPSQRIVRLEFVVDSSTGLEEAINCEIRQLETARVRTAYSTAMSIPGSRKRYLWAAFVSVPASDRACTVDVESGGACMHDFAVWKMAAQLSSASARKPATTEVPEAAPEYPGSPPLSIQQVSPGVVHLSTDAVVTPGAVGDWVVLARSGKRVVSAKMRAEMETGTYPVGRAGIRTCRFDADYNADIDRIVEVHLRIRRDAWHAIGNVALAPNAVVYVPNGKDYIAAANKGAYSGDVRSAPGGVARFADDVSVKVDLVTDLSSTEPGRRLNWWVGPAAPPSAAPWSTTVLARNYNSNVIPADSIAPIPIAWPSSKQDDALRPAEGERKVGFIVDVATPRRNYVGLRWMVFADGSSVPVSTVGQFLPGTPYDNSLHIRYAISAVVPRSARTCTVRVCVPDGVLHDVADWTAGGRNTLSASQWIADKPGGPALRIAIPSTSIFTILSVPQPIDFGISVTANVIGPDGQTGTTTLNDISSRIVSTHGGTTIVADTLTATGVPLSRVRSIHLKMGFPHWRDIENVPLWPSKS
jgi:beta-lactamase regulating signal transducer with metallopeptidase domain